MKEKICVPPIKIQGIKTKLVSTIRNTVDLSEKMIWVEPFMGSGVVGFNICHKKAIFADLNPYIIDFYNALKRREINSQIIKCYLEHEGKLLAEGDQEHYYKVRERFNEEHNPLDFLFLNRSCFNGIIRFNQKNKFNVPYGHKPQRFSKAYITKIVNQIKYVEECLLYYDWQFVCQSFETTINQCNEKCFIYCDPPYIGRHVDYFDTWNIDKEISLKNSLVKSKIKFMVSTWDHNKYRKNECIETIWGFCKKITKEHFYFVGGNECNRNNITEALLVNY